MAKITNKILLLFAVALGLFMNCSGDGPSALENPDPGNNVTSPVPAALGLNPFYKKYLDAGGIPIVGSEKVEERAFLAARDIITNMLAKDEVIRDAMILHNARVGIMAFTEVTTDIPEHAHLKNDPNTNWDTRARGLGGTLASPITTFGEENVLCDLKNVDRYRTENIFVHEFAHAIHLIGLTTLNSNFDSELRSIFALAQAEGLWSNTYANTNHLEYWAEGVQDWFNVNREVAAANGVHNHVNTREELRDFDPRLYDLIALYFPDTDWTPECSN